MKKQALGILTLALIMVSNTVASSAEQEGWRFQISPYLWLAGLEGDLTVRGRTADFERSASDLFDALEAAAAAQAVAQFDRYLFLTQWDWVSLDTDRLDVRDQPQRGSVKSDMLLGEVAAGYRFGGRTSGITTDVLVGARYLHMKTDFAIEGGSTFSNSHDLIDPVLVVRPNISLFPSRMEGLSFDFLLAIGGGGDSDFVYELAPQLIYDINPNWDIRLGYRTVGYRLKRDSSDNELDIRLSGILVGIGFTF